MENLEGVVKSIDDIEKGAKYQIIDIKNGKVVARGATVLVTEKNGSEFYLKSFEFEGRFNMNYFLEERTRRLVRIS